MLQMLPTALRPQTCPLAGRGPRAAAGRASVRPSRRQMICRAEQSSDEEQPPPVTTEEPAAGTPAAEPAAATENENANLQLPQDVVQRIRDTVFSFDTFFVTGEQLWCDGARLLRSAELAQTLGAGTSASIPYQPAP